MIEGFKIRNRSILKITENFIYHDFRIAINYFVIYDLKFRIHWMNKILLIVLVFLGAGWTLGLSTDLLTIFTGCGECKVPAFNWLCLIWLLIATGVIFTISFVFSFGCGLSSLVYSWLCWISCCTVAFDCKANLYNYFKKLNALDLRGRVRAAYASVTLNLCLLNCCVFRWHAALLNCQSWSLSGPLGSSLSQLVVMELVYHRVDLIYSVWLFVVENCSDCFEYLRHRWRFY